MDGYFVNCWVDYVIVVLVTLFVLAILGDISR